MARYYHDNQSTEALYLGLEMLLEMVVLVLIIVVVVALWIKESAGKRDPRAVKKQWNRAKGAGTNSTWLAQRFTAAAHSLCPLVGTSKDTITQ